MCPLLLLQPQPPACLSWDTESLWEEVQPLPPPAVGALATLPPVLAKGLNLLF